MEYAITTTQLGYIFLSLASLSVALIYLLRLHTRRRRIDVFAYRSQLLKVGMLTAMVSSLAALSWTTYSKDDHREYIIEPYEEEIQVLTPRTSSPKPPPPLPEIIVPIDEPDIVQPDIEPIEDLTIETTVPTELSEDTVINEPTPIPLPAPPPPPVREEPTIPDIVVFAEQQPRFPGCEDVPGGNMKKAECARKKLLEFLYKNIKYPPIAKENGIEGTTYIQFVVEVDGRISNIKVARALDGGCSQEAERVVRMMNDLPDPWIAGRQNGRPVRVQYTLPVKFQLQ